MEDDGEGSTARSGIAVVDDNAIPVEERLPAADTDSTTPHPTAEGDEEYNAAPVKERLPAADADNTIVHPTAEGDVERIATPVKERLPAADADNVTAHPAAEGDVEHNATLVKERLPAADADNTTAHSVAEGDVDHNATLVKESLPVPDTDITIVHPAAEGDLKHHATLVQEGLPVPDTDNSIVHPAAEGDVEHRVTPVKEGVPLEETDAGDTEHDAIPVAGSLRVADTAAGDAEHKPLPVKEGLLVVEMKQYTALVGNADAHALADEPALGDAGHASIPARGESEHVNGAAAAAVTEASSVVGRVNGKALLYEEGRREAAGDISNQVEKHVDEYHTGKTERDFNATEKVGKAREEGTTEEEAQLTIGIVDDDRKRLDEYDKNTENKDGERNIGENLNDSNQKREEKREQEKRAQSDGKVDVTHVPATAASQAANDDGHALPLPPAHVPAAPAVAPHRPSDEVQITKKVLPPIATKLRSATPSRPSLISPQRMELARHHRGKFKHVAPRVYDIDYSRRTPKSQRHPHEEFWRNLRSAPQGKNKKVCLSPTPPFVCPELQSADALQKRADILFAMEGYERWAAQYGTNDTTEVAVLGTLLSALEDHVCALERDPLDRLNSRCIRRRGDVAQLHERGQRAIGEVFMYFSRTPAPIANNAPEPTQEDMYIAASRLSAAQFFEFYERFNLNLVVHRGEAEVALSRFADDLEFRQFLHVLLQLAEIGFSRAPYKAENEDAPKDLRMLLFKLSRFMGLHDPKCAFRMKMPALKQRCAPPRRSRRKERGNSQPSSPRPMNRPSPACVWRHPVEKTQKTELPQGRPPQPHAVCLPALNPPQLQNKKVNPPVGSTVQKGNPRDGSNIHKIKPPHASALSKVKPDDRSAVPKIRPDQGGTVQKVKSNEGFASCPVPSEGHDSNTLSAKQFETTPMVNVSEPIKGPRRRLLLLTPLKQPSPDHVARGEPEATPRAASEIMEIKEPDAPKPSRLRLLKKKTKVSL